MELALLFVISLAAIGPIAIPIRLRDGRMRSSPIYAFFLTNLITLSPMIGIVLWARNFPPTPCRELYPDAPCDGIPSDAGWLILALLLAPLILWGLIASLCTTFYVFTPRE